MKIEFVSAKERDAEKIVSLREKIWKTTYRGIYPDDMLDNFDYSWHLGKEVSEIKNPDYSAFLIFADEINAGYVIILKKEEIVLQSLYLLPEFQRNGIGRKAFDFVSGFCRRNGADSFICHCHPKNLSAMAFYAEIGGKIIGKDFSDREEWKNSVTYEFSVE